MAKKSQEILGLKIGYCEDEIEDLIRFVTFLRSVNGSTRRKPAIPEHFYEIYNSDFSVEDNIEMAAERIYDMRRQLESLRRRAEESVR